MQIYRLVTENARNIKDTSNPAKPLVFVNMLIDVEVCMEPLQFLDPPNGCVLNDGGNMAIRNGDKVNFRGEGGIQNLSGEVLTIPRKGPNKGSALIKVYGLRMPIWIDIGRLSKS